MVVVTHDQVTLWTGCTAVRGWWVGWGGGEVIHAQTQTTVSRPKNCQTKLVSFISKPLQYYQQLLLSGRELQQYYIIVI